MALTRRELIASSLGVLGGCALGWVSRPGATDRGSSSTPAKLAPPQARQVIPDVLSAEVALQRLIEGNRRFVAGQGIHPHETRTWRSQLVSSQHPFAVILGCADSRVPPEVLFDEGLGDLFVIRQAGHVADDDSLASIEYAVHHLHVPLVVVLGHQGCGAVSAAVGVILHDEPVEGHIIRLIDDISPAVMEVRGQAGDLVEAAVRANIRQVVGKLHESRPIIHASEEHGEVRVVGAYYSLDTGEVEWLDR